MDQPGAAERAARFGELYDSTYASVLRFALRRVGPGEIARAEDIAHETFLVAWRRLDTVPPNSGESLAWLYAVARNCLLTDQRAQNRRTALAVRVAGETNQEIPAPDDNVSTRLDFTAAWHSLSAKEQEVISLSAWDGLTSVQAGQVLGISSANYRIRLNRARQTLRRALENRK